MICWSNTLLLIMWECLLHVLFGRTCRLPDMSNSIETAIAIAIFGTIAIGIAIAIKAIFQLLLLLLVLLRQSQNYCS